MATDVNSEEDIPEGVEEPFAILDARVVWKQLKVYFHSPVAGAFYNDRHSYSPLFFVCLWPANFLPPYSLNRSCSQALTGHLKL